MDWLSIDNTSGAVFKNSSIKIKLKEEKLEVLSKELFFRIDNGFSIPITVFYQ